MEPIAEMKNQKYILKKLKSGQARGKTVMEIENLRECLNRMIVSKEFDFNEILKVSRDLDCLITQYYVSGDCPAAKYRGMLMRQ